MTPTGLVRLQGKNAPRSLFHYLVHMGYFIESIRRPIARRAVCCGLLAEIVARVGTLDQGGSSQSLARHSRRERPRASAGRSGWIGLVASYTARAGGARRTST